MGFDLNVSIPAFTVFLQGLLSFFSPCVLPLVPLYLGYLSGGTLRRDTSSDGSGATCLRSAPVGAEPRSPGPCAPSRGRYVYDRRKVLVNTTFFVIGISFAFFLLGLGFTALGTFFTSRQVLFARLGGVLMILLGLYQLGFLGESKLLSREIKLPLEGKLSARQTDEVSFVGGALLALLLGFTFSFAWTPCVGPALTSVLIMASSARTATRGFLLIGVYTLGFVLPFLAVGLFTSEVLTLFQKHRNIVRYTVKAGGVLMILLGFMVYTGRMNAITGYLSTM
ncbi:MAG: cytochrome c biogenesis protein CcdA [Lachnospiraceae bacterium]|nr:cytochrome c biogenesis protein CcdA [Lachnospiraceae bacterium]